jgi:very-short-patch-repair endonuclease
MLSRDILDYMGARHWVASIGELRTLGLTLRQIQHLLATGELTAKARGVYQLTGAPSTWLTRGRVACATSKYVVLSHLTGGRLNGLRKCDTDDLHVTCPGHGHPVISGATIHRSHRLDDEDIVWRPDGLRVTTPARTLFDLAKVLKDGPFESAVEHALRLEIVTIPELFAIGDRLRQQGRDGSARFGRIIGQRDVAMAPVDSDLELRVERALLDAGLPRPLRQHPFTVEGGQRIRVDFYWPEQRVVLEVDHAEWHSSRAASESDKWRDRQLQRCGIATVRVTDRDVNTRLERVVNDVRVILIARSSAS